MHFRILKQILTYYILTYLLTMIATSGFLAALECTKFAFGRGCGSLQRPQTP